MKAAQLLLSLVLMALLCADSSLRAQNPSPAQEPQEIDVIRVTTSLVTVPVSVKSSEGGFIPNLGRESFRIYEDGVEQRIAHFETADQPFTIILALDISDSTKIELKDIQNAAVAFLRQLKPSDRVQIVAFDKNLTTLTEVTGDLEALSRAIRRTKTGGGTSLYDAMQVIMTDNQKRIAGRKAIVILTDGIDTSSVGATFASTVPLAAAQFALVYPVQYNSVGDVLGKQLSSQNSAMGHVIYTTPSGEPVSKAFARGTRYLQMIAQVSGGHFQYAASLKDLEHSFAHIAEELRQQNSLGYYPSNRNKKGKRRIKITVNASGATVHARESYSYIPDNQ